MKGFLLLLCLVMALAAAPASAAPSHVISSACLAVATPATNALNMSEVPSIFMGDPGGDGINSCSADDCRVCNNNGLMCTPTKAGCDCEYWPE